MSGTRKTTRPRRKGPTKDWTRCSEGIEYKKLGDGGVLYRVRWVEGGGRGPRDGEAYFGSHDEAKEFRGLLIANGRRDPRKNQALLNAIEAAAPEPQPEDTPRLKTVMTFGQLVEDYLAYLARLGKAKPAQLAHYRRQFDQHVRIATVAVRDPLTGQTRTVGPLGGLPLSEITTAVIDAWVHWMQHRTWVYRKARPQRRTRDGQIIPAVPEERRQYAPKTLHNIHGTVISPALGWAARTGLLEANPCAGIELPEMEDVAVSLDQVPVGDEIPGWIALAYEVSTLAGDIVSIAVATGLRWSELTALRPCDIDLKERVLRVTRTTKEDEQRRLFVAPYGKTDSALRTIRFDKELKPVLKRLCEGRKPRELILQRSTGASGFCTTHWAKVMRLAAECGMKQGVTVHKFRHSHATELLGANVSMDTVSKRLGHKDIVVTTQPYSHLDPGRDTTAADVLDIVMRPKSKKKPKKTSKRLALAA